MAIPSVNLCGVNESTFFVVEVESSCMYKNLHLASWCKRVFLGAMKLLSSLNHPVCNSSACPTKLTITTMILQVGDLFLEKRKIYDKFLDFMTFAL